MLLAIDTSEQTCSAALINADGEASHRSENIGRGHAERLLPLIDELLTEFGAAYQDVTRLVVTTGPGTFTGLRVGLSVARGIALANAVPCVGLSGLEVLACQAYQENADYSCPVHALIKGRAGQVFYQQFLGAQNDGVPKKVGGPLNADIAEIAAHIEQNPGLVVGSGSELLIDYGSGHLVDASQSHHLVIDPVCLGRAGSGVDPASYRPDPLYLREADAKKAVPLLPVDGVQ